MMIVIDKLAKALLGVAGMMFFLSAMSVDSYSYLPLIILFLSELYMCLYVFGWKKVIRLATPVKEVRALINRGVTHIRIDYRRIPKAWHIVVNEELADAGYKMIRHTESISLWTV